MTSHLTSSAKRPCPPHPILSRGGGTALRPAAPMLRTPPENLMQIIGIYKGLSPCTMGIFTGGDLPLHR